MDIEEFLNRIIEEKDLTRNEIDKLIEEKIRELPATSGLFLKNVLEYINTTKNQELKDLKNEIIQKLEESTGIILDELLFLFSLKSKYFNLSETDITRYKELRIVCSFDDIINDLTEFKEREYSIEYNIDDVITNSIDITEHDGYIYIQDKYIKILEIMNAKLKEIPENISILSELEYLILSGNKLTTIPNSIGSLKRLKIIDLSYNKIETLPESLVNLPSLRSLNLAFNPILKAIPEFIIQFAETRMAEKYIKEGVKQEESNILAVLEIICGPESIILTPNYKNFEIDNKGHVIKLYFSSDYYAENAEYLPEIVWEYCKKLKYCDVVFYD